MVNKKFWLGTLVMALVFGVIVVSGLNAQTDTRSNGNGSTKKVSVPFMGSRNMVCHIK